MSITTEFSFILPRGYVGSDGTLHRRGVMRLATARDEIEPLRDPRVQGPDDPYLTIIVLSRVVSQLGTLGAVTPREIEGLFAADLAFLQDLYGVVNFGTVDEVQAFLRASAVPEAAPAPAPPPAASAPVAEFDGGDTADDDDDEDDDAVEAPPVVHRARANARVEEVTRND